MDDQPNNRQDFLDDFNAAIGCRNAFIIGMIIWAGILYYAFGT